MMIYSEVNTDSASLLRYEALFSNCFPKSGKFDTRVLRWLYAENPDGPVIGFDAFDGDILAAHYVCIPAIVRLHGKPEKVLLSLNTATDPTYQGKGLFTKLAEMTYQAAADRSFAGAYGVANANSTPGFIRKLGFQLVQPLDAKLGVGRLGVDMSAASAHAQFERVWSRDALEWRTANPANPVQPFLLNDGTGFTANAMGRGLTAYAELATLPGYSAGKRPAHSPLHLFLGLVPQPAKRFAGYVDIPLRLRPSPLNMIFRSFKSQTMNRLDTGFIHFSFLDFDAY